MILHRHPLIVALLGCFLVLGSLLFYQAALSRALSEGRQYDGIFENWAYVTLMLTVAGIFTSLLGVTRYIRGRVRNMPLDTSSTTSILASVLADFRALRILALSAVVYGIFFGVASRVVIYEPELISNTYGVTVPSVQTAICCGPLGQMPQFVVYVTQHFAILIIPIDLVLLSIVSWLVGLNAAIATYAYANRRGLSKTRWVGGVGSIIGLFTACPTCAGFFLLSFFGLSGAFSLSLTLASLQGVFVAIGIPVLVVSPFLALRKFSAAQACAPAGRKMKSAHASS